MEPAKKSLRPNLILIVLIAGLVAFILYIAFFVDITQVIETLSQTNLIIYGGAFITYMLYTICSSIVWRSLLSTVSVKVTKGKAFLFTWVGLFFEATVPQLGWSAEISKTYLLAKDSNVESGRIGASVVAQKIFTMTLTIAALSAGLGLVLFRYSLSLLVSLSISLILILSILTLAVVYYVSFKPSATTTLLNWAIKIALVFRKNWKPQNFRAKTERLLGNFHVNIDQLKRNPKALIQPIIYAVVGFVFEVSVVFITFLALGQPIPVDVVLIVFTLTGTLQSVGVALPGLPELVMALSFKAFGIETSIAVSAALLTRIVNLWFRLGVSYAALQWAGIKIIRENKTK